MRRVTIQYTLDFQQNRDGKTIARLLENKLNAIAM